MQKTMISIPPKAKNMNYFKYEMKDTNQLLKGLISCNMGGTIQRSVQIKEQNNNQVSLKESSYLRKIENIGTNDIKKYFGQKKSNQIEQGGKYREKQFVKYQDELQNDQNEIFKDILNDSLMSGRRKKVENCIEDLILQRFYIDLSQNEENQESQKGIVQKYKNKDWQNIGEKCQEFKENKKQKKGLANISLRVKNIVSQYKKLSYKEVSDLVLEYSNDQLQQLDQNQRIRQIKNIKRRVYDALNVLVSVGILGKHQRCVCMTQWTNVPGKKHSNQWQKINSKIQHINKLKRSCADKSQALKLLIDKYNAINALRNKHQIQNKELKQLQYKPKQNYTQQTQNQKVQQNNKLYFPVIVFCPAFDQDPTDKLTVSFLQEQQDGEYSALIQKKQRVKISGKNITMLGDFDCALEMDLQKYRELQKERKLLQEIEAYAEQNLKKKMSGYRFLTLDHRQENIEDYFTDQIFY